MEIVHTARSEYQACIKFCEFRYNNYENVKYSYEVCPFRVVTNDGNIHYFMGLHTYDRWCKGRTYILNDKYMHSGSAIKDNVKIDKE